MGVAVIANLGMCPSSLAADQRFRIGTRYFAAAGKITLAFIRGNRVQFRVAYEKFALEKTRERWLP
jgi:hypothetical protein